MLEPTLALQKAIRARLIDAPDVLALVQEDHIRAGSTRPDDMPEIIMSNGSTTLHGHDYTSQRAAWVYMDLHVWTKSEGQLSEAENKAKEITFAVTQALDKNLDISGGYCDQFRVTGCVFPRDPDPAYGHGVLSVEALIRWIV